jgi:hypothetical protein
MRADHQVMTLIAMASGGDVMPSVLPGVLFHGGCTVDTVVSRSSAEERAMAVVGRPRSPVAGKRRRTSTPLRDHRATFQDENGRSSVADRSNTTWS